MDASGPLFQAGLLTGQYRQMKAAWEESQLAYEENILKAFHEVSGQLYTRLKYQDALARQTRSVAAYQDAVKLATERYRAGHADYFEILDAQGQAFGLGGRKVIGLCRCGMSQNKPFCDGSHRNGFADAPVARDLPAPMPKP